MRIRVARAKIMAAERQQAPGRPRVRPLWQDNGICPPLAVKEKEGRGRGVYTTEDLKCGTKVLPPIAPLACARMSDARGSYCDYCFKTVEDCGKPLRRCGRCKFAYYCNKACQEGDWRSHKHECRVTISKAWLSVMMRLVLRCMHLQGKEKQELDLLLASDDKLLSEGASKDTQNCIHGVLGFLDTDDPATKKKIIDIAYKITFNGFSIHEDELRPIGVGLYTCFSLFNHSCVPNCAAVSDGRKLVVRTVADIKAGEQLVVSYLDPFDTPEQRKLKLTEYGFECHCEMCNTELYPDSPFRALEAGLEGSSPDEVSVAVERGVESLKRAKYLMDMDDWRRALVEIESSLSRQAGVLHRMHYVTLTAQEQLYYAYMGLENLPMAVEACKKLSESYQRYLPKYHPVMGSHLFRLGTLLFQLGVFSKNRHKLSESLTVLTKGVEHLRVTHGPDHPYTQYAVATLDKAQAVLSMLSEA